MENKDLNVLWRPSSKIKEESNLNQFIKNFVDEFKNQSDVKYEELWKWSIEKPEKFWDSIWDYSNVLGEKGEILLKDKDKMPGARFFPNAKLNYTENVLKNKNEPLAIISEREDGLKSKISTLELKDKVLKLAGWLKENGISKGDRVCAYMPNCPETIITMLATASLGAVFSSCSTDFGVAGVLDRFQQIEPKILVTVDGYLYNGKSIDRYHEIHEIVNGLETLEKTVVLNIWADWCPPCIVEMPYFNKLNELEDVVVLGFHFDQFDVLETEEVNRLIKKFKVEFNNIETDPRDIWGMEIPVHVPTTYIIKNNEIIETLITPQTYESLIEATSI